MIGPFWTFRGGFGFRWNGAHTLNVYRCSGGRIVEIDVRTFGDQQEESASTAEWLAAVDGWLEDDHYQGGSDGPQDVHHLRLVR